MAADILRFAVVSYVVVAVVVFVFARPVSRIFVTDSAILPQTNTFIRIAAFAVIWMGIDTVAVGALRGASDTRWPLYGKLVGLYVFALPIAYLGIVTPLGLTGVFLAFVAEVFVYLHSASIVSGPTTGEQSAERTRRRRSIVVYLERIHTS